MYQFWGLQKKVLQNLLRKLNPIWLKPLEKKYYVSIRELPAKNWFLSHKENDLNYLCKVGKIDYRVLQVYEKLNDEIINTFGISKDFSKQIKLKINIELLYAKMYDKNDKSLELQIFEREKELENLQKVQGNFDIYDSIVAMNKSGIQCDINTLTYYDLLNYSNSLAKLIKNENNNA